MAEYPIQSPNPNPRRTQVKLGQRVHCYALRHFIFLFLTTILFLFITIFHFISHLFIVLFSQPYFLLFFCMVRFVKDLN